MNFSDFLDYQIGSLTVGRILTAILLAALCYFLSKPILRFFDKALKKSRMDRSLQGFFKGTIHVFVYFIIIVLVARCLKISVVSFVAAFSIVGLAVSMAAEGVLSNLFGGISLLMLKPFRVGDYVKVGDTAGIIREIGLFYTQISAPPNSEIIYIPNSNISTNQIINCNALGENVRMIELKVTASYDAPAETVKNALMDAVKSVPDILPAPAPFTAVSAYKDSNVEYLLRVWAANKTYYSVYYRLLEQIRTSFGNSGVEMTYNHLNVHLKSGSAPEEK